MKLIGRICFVSALIMMLPPSMANAQKKNVVLHYDFMRNMQVADFRIYNICIADKELKKLVCMKPL